MKVSNVELREAMAEVRGSVDTLKDTLHREAVAIKRLARWLVWMTGALVVMTLAILVLTSMLSKHGS